jgi:hypothetical protein
MMNALTLNTALLGGTGPGVIAAASASLLYRWGSDDSLVDSTVALEFTVRTRDIVPSRENRRIHLREIGVRYVGNLTVRLYVNGTLKQTKTLPPRETMGMAKYKTPSGLFAATVSFELTGDDEVEEIGLIGAEEVGMGR